MRAACVLALVLAAGCSSYEYRLRSEREIAGLRELVAACDALPQRPLDAISDADPGGRLHIAGREYGSGQHARVLVAIHGVLSDHRAWRYVVGGLGDDFDVWAVDMPGCGDSDKPSARDLGDDGYSPTWLGRHLLAALRDRLAHCDHEVRLTLVAHSLGGGAVLRMLGDEQLAHDYADVLARIDGAILLAPLAFKLVHVDPNLLALAQIEDLVFTIGTGIGEVRRAAAAATWHGFVDPRRAPAEDFQQTVEALLDPDRRHAMQLMLRRAVPRQADGRVIWDQVLALTADYSRVRVPCLIVWGERDETLPSVHGYELAFCLPDARLRLLANCMHSVMLEQPSACTELIRRFVTEDIAGWKNLDRIEPVARSEESKGESLARKEATEQDVSSLHDQPASEAPSTVSVLLGRDLQRSGARDLSDALRMLPGVEVQRTSSTESGVAFRGYVDSSTALQGVLGLLDGRQVYNPFLGNVLWDQLPVRLEDVDRVEVIRGPGSFLHGPNAMHGVVSIKTLSPLDHTDSSASASTHFGSHGSVVTGTSVVARGRHTAIKTTAQWEDIGQFTGERSGSQGKGFVTTAFETELDDDPNSVLGVSGGASQQRFDLLLPLLEPIPSTILDNESQELFATATYRAGNPDDRAIEFRMSWTGFDSDSLPQDHYAPFELNLDTFDADVQAHWVGGSHMLTAGLGYRYSGFVTHDLDVAGGRHSVDQGWSFAQDEFDIADSWTFTLGMRVDLHTETGAVWSPRAATVWEFVDRHFLRASLGRGFRNPALRELVFEMPVRNVPGVPSGVTIVGNSHLEPESLTSYELGYVGSWGKSLEPRPEHALTDLDGTGCHQFEAGVTAFYNRIDDLISFQPDPLGAPVVRPVNQDDEESFGLELEGRYVFGDFTSAFANYSLVTRRDRETGRSNPLAPRHVANLGLTYASRGLRAMLWTNFYDRTELFGTAIPSYLLLNGSIGYGFELSGRAKGQVFVRGFNLLDDDHREHPQGDSYGAILSFGVQLDW